MAHQNINEIADHFISQVDGSAGDVITPLKLQKLVYYAQAWHLVIFDKPLVNSQFQAWAHGPVSPALYARFAGYGFNPIETQGVASKIRSKKVRKFLDEIWRVYGGLSAKALENLTHSEKPWIDARAGLDPLEKSKKVISRDSIKKYYAKKLKDGRAA